MVARNTVHGPTRFNPGGTKCICLECDGTTAQSQRRATEKLIKDRFDLPLRFDKKMQARKMVKEMQKSPLGRLITTIATTPELRPEKVGRGKRILQYSDFELNEKLLQAMEHVLDELS
jgi:hypothetical protein